MDGEDCFQQGSLKPMFFGSETMGRKLLAGTVVLKADSRSIDCVVVRFANDNFAQDDKVFWDSSALGAVVGGD
jgi:hypothetical protein